jgi:hypothetical protein
VPGHLEEERRVERGVDDPQQVGGVATHLELFGSCSMQPNVYMLSVNSADDEDEHDNAYRCI